MLLISIAVLLHVSALVSANNASSTPGVAPTPSPTTTTARQIYCTALTLTSGLMVCEPKCSSNQCSLQTECRYGCYEGYRISNVVTRTCQSDGSWSHVTSIPNCQAILCPALSSLASGSITCSKNSQSQSCHQMKCPYQTQCSYGCDAGYRLSRQVTQLVRTCQSSGLWSNEDPTCQAILCPALSSLASGSITCSKNSQSQSCHQMKCPYQTQCSYGCDAGYRLSRQVTQLVRTCQSSGLWSNEDPTCQEVLCSTLSPPTSGSITCSENVQSQSCHQKGCPIQAQCSYRCRTGYWLSRQVTRTCQSNGQWSSEVPPTCQEVSCSTLNKPLSGSIRCSKNRAKKYCAQSRCPYQTQCSYGCDTGYRLSHQVRRTCQSSGRWSNNFIPTCQDINECLTSSRCHSNATCTNFDGSYTCACNNGYTGNGQYCSELWVSQRSQSNCEYYFSSFRSTFDMASKRCQGWSSSLAILKTQDLVSYAETQISEIYPAQTSRRFYIGLSFNQSWQWIDGDAATLSNSGRNQCGIITQQPSLTDVPCSQAQYFICERQKISSARRACSPNPCRNGGTCKPIGCSFMCMCPNNFYGYQCDAKQLEIKSSSSVSVVLGQELTLSYNIVNHVTSTQLQCNLTQEGSIKRRYRNEMSIIYKATIQSSTKFEMTCSLVDKKISTTHTTTVSVHIPAEAQASQLEVKLKRNTTCSGAQCIVTCTGVGFPLPRVSWVKNGVNVSKVSTSSVHQVFMHINATTNIGKLILSKARYSDSGFYNCTSTNVVGPENKTISKHVTVDVQIVGAPEENIARKSVSSPKNNKVKFRCYFDGNPRPALEWKLSNGSSLPKSSQFHVSKQSHPSDVQANLNLTVYGANCIDTSLLQFRCFATNSHSTSVPSRVFKSGLGKYLQFESTWKSCSDAITHCKGKGGTLPVASSQASLRTIKSKISGPPYGFWVSAASSKYFTDWTSRVQSPGGCFYILSSNFNPKKTTWTGKFVCDIRPSPQANVTHHVDECNGTRVNISWNIQPGAESLEHRVFYEQNKTLTTPPGQSSVTLFHLKPRFSYDIKVLPLFEGCSGVSLIKSHKIKTGRGLLDSPTAVFIKKTDNTCTVTWNIYMIAGKYAEYNKVTVWYIKVQNVKRNPMNKTISKSNTTILNKSARQHTITELAPNTNYKVYVGAVPSSPCQDKIPVTWSKNFTGSCITEPKGPSSVPLSSKSPISVTGSVKVFLEPVSERNGLISCYFVVAYKVLNGSNNSAESNFTKLRQAGDVVKDGESYIAMAMLPFAQATDVALGDSSYSCCDVSATSGTSNCSVTSPRKRRNVASGSVVRGYNRPLIAGANYSYYIITATPVASGFALIYTASSPQGFIYRPTSGPRGDVGLYVGLAILALLILVILVIAFIYRKPLKKRLRRRLPKEQPVAAQNGVPLQPVRQSNNHEDSFESDGGGSESGYLVNVNEQLSRYRIAASSLLDVYLNKRADEDRLFLDEFKSFLPGIVTKAEVKTNYAKQPQLHSKNRFRNVVPSDDARVVLRKSGSDPFSSYINASFIDGYNAPSKYIAAQGPKQETVKDFWRMIVENHCTVIVMLTKLMENYKAKCERYWPEPGQEMESGPIRIVSKSEASLGDFVMRKLAVSSQRPAISIEVTQLHFMAWPDHGVPATTSSLFHIHKAAMEAQTNHSGPIVVHCSAGVGRTGTFMALDVLKSELEARKEVNVLESVYRMRLHRTEMVQSLGQYVLLHKLLAEINEFGETDVDVSEFQKYTERLKIVDRTRRVTKLHLQFEQLDLVPPSLSEMKSANKPINRQLNNDSSVLPYDHSLAFVGMLSTDGEIPYLNASSVMAYNTGYYYISAQDPIENNANSFWRCVVDNQIRVIIMLGEATCFEYWEDKNRHRCFPEFKINTVSTCPTRYYTDRDLTLVRNGSEDEPHHVKHITFHSWKQQSSVPSVSSLLDLISVIEGYQADVQEVRGKKFIALLHCSDGSSRCGVLCAVANLLERLKNENRVDVFRAVKDLRDCRPHMVGDVQQYEFCYQAVCEYLQSFDLYGNFK